MGFCMITASASSGREFGTARRPSPILTLSAGFARYGAAIRSRSTGNVKIDAVVADLTTSTPPVGDHAHLQVVRGLFLRFPA